MENTMPETLIEAIRFYSDVANCEATMISIRYVDGVVTCPDCNLGDRVGKLSRPGVWKCNRCKRQFTLKVGTIFEDSPLPLSTWFPAVWLIAGAKNGISSCEVSRALGVTQKTAWFMLHRIRHAMNTGSFAKPIDGIYEADETFIGGLEKNKHADKKLNAGRGAVGKAIVSGIIQRGGKVSVKRISDTSAKTLQKRVREEVAAGSALMTDAHRGYTGLAAEYQHQIVDHAVEYVRGNVHTNSMENFWSLLKRTLKGTYVAVDVPHLDAYLDEQMFRFNERDLNDLGRFLTVMGAVTGKRLTYEDLIGRADTYHLQPGR